MGGMFSGQMPASPDACDYSVTTGAVFEPILLEHVAEQLRRAEMRRKIRDRELSR
jgi:hypothetical protein